MLGWPVRRPRAVRLAAERCVRTSVVRDPRNGPAYDLPPPPAEGMRTWILASVPRSGSTLLCRMLWETGGAGAPKEYLNPAQIRDWEVRLGESLWVRARHRALVGPLTVLAGRGRWDDCRLAAYLSRLRSRRSTSEGWFGLKLHYHHFRRFFLEPGRSVERFLGPTRWVAIRRRDRLAQAVSWARALQSGRWASHQRPRWPAVYCRPQIEWLQRRIVEQESGWERYFERERIEPLRLEYEDLAADPEAAVRRVLRFLGLERAETMAVARPPIRRQADERSARWIARYRARATA